MVPGILSEEIAFDDDDGLRDDEMRASNGRGGVVKDSE